METILATPPPATLILTPLDVLRRAARTAPNKVLFFHKTAEFSHRFTALEVYQRIQQLALGLRSLGVGLGTKVGILAPSTPRWEIAHMAILMAGGVVVGLDPQDSPENYSRIIEKCQMKFLFLEGKTYFEKLEKTLGTQEPIQIINLGNPQELPSALAWQEIGRLADPSTGFGREPSPQDPATIIFTSGTTGESKGIEYTHGQLVYAVDNFLKVFPEIKSGCRSVCWLPLSSFYQRMVNLYTLRVLGEIHFVDKPVDLMKRLPEISPDFLFSVPRFYEKVHAGIQNKIAGSSFLKRCLSRFALRVGRQYSQKQRLHQQPGTPLRILHGFCDRWVLAKIRSLFGSQMRFMFSGSAPLRVEVLEFFHSIGILILEAYGTSENTSAIACNRCKDFRFGSVGRPIVEDSVRVSEEGEIWIKGYGVFQGYYKEDNTGVFEGKYYKTGDLGRIDSDGFIYLTGRKSDVFKTSTGIKVPALAIQTALQKLPWVDGAAALGEFRKTPIALISVDVEGLASQTNTPVEQIWDRPRGSLASGILARLESDLRKTLLDIPQKFRPAGVLVLPRKFSYQEHEITSNMKMRRRFIEEKFSSVMDSFYGELDSQSAEAPIRFLSL